MANVIDGGKMSWSKARGWAIRCLSKDKERVRGRVGVAVTDERASTRVGRRVMMMIAKWQKQR